MAIQKGPLVQIPKVWFGEGKASVYARHTAAGMNQTDFAADCGVNRWLLSTIRNGKGSGRAGARNIHLIRAGLQRLPDPPAPKDDGQIPLGFEDSEAPPIPPADLLIRQIHGKLDRLEGILARVEANLACLSLKA